MLTALYLEGDTVKAGRMYVGTSGWSYAYWAKGLFYPKGLRQPDWLQYYSRCFSTVEVNASFYRPPRPEMIARWREVTPTRFRLAVKLWRRVTHEKRLSDCAAELRDFLATVVELRAKRGPLLVQLPPSLKRDTVRMGDFLAELKCAAHRFRWRVAVEFRNAEWICDQVYELLDRYNAAICLADMPRCPITEPNDVGFVYIRRHGPGGRYRGATPAGTSPTMLNASGHGFGPAETCTSTTTTTLKGMPSTTPGSSSKPCKTDFGPGSQTGLRHTRRLRLGRHATLPDVWKSGQAANRTHAVGIEIASSILDADLDMSEIEYVVRSLSYFGRVNGRRRPRPLAGRLIRDRRGQKPRLPCVPAHAGAVRGCRDGEPRSATRRQQPPPAAASTPSWTTPATRRSPQTKRET